MKTIAIIDDDIYIGNMLEEILMKDLVKNSDTNPFLIFNYCVELQYKNGIKAVMEFLEKFGFYFNEIEVA